MSNRHVLVTGGMGFIGSELVAQLVYSSSAHVTVVDNFSTGRRENLRAIPSERMTLVEEDLRHLPQWANLLDGVGSVYHLACLGVRHSLHSPRENHDVNATGTLALLEAARGAGVERFLHVSSSEVYGSAKSVPMSEDHPVSPTTPYGASKLAGESYARAFQATYGFPVTVVRPFNAYGPNCHHEGDSGEVIPRFLLRALASKPMLIFGDGQQTRDFTQVADIVRGIRLAADSTQTIGGVYNLGSGREITILALAKAVAEAVGREAQIETRPARPGDVFRLCADASLAQKVFGFEVTVGFREGLVQLAQWYEQQAVAPEQLLRQEHPGLWR